MYAPYRVDTRNNKNRVCTIGGVLCIRERLNSEKKIEEAEVYQHEEVGAQEIIKRFKISKNVISGVGKKLQGVQSKQLAG